MIIKGDILYCKNDLIHNNVCYCEKGQEVIVEGRLPAKNGNMLIVIDIDHITIKKFAMNFFYDADPDYKNVSDYFMDEQERRDRIKSIVKSFIDVERR